MIRTLSSRLASRMNCSRNFVYRPADSFSSSFVAAPAVNRNTIFELQQLPLYISHRGLHSSLVLNTTWRELDMNTSDRKRLRDKLSSADAAEARTVDSMAAPVLDSTSSILSSSTAALRTVWFPDEHTNSMMIDGIKYEELPIVHVKATKNNTILTLTDHKGTIFCQRSAGTEGFVNAKKGTNIAGQAAGSTMAFRAIDKGIKYVRVVVRGIGPGRFSSIKGLQISGLTVVSVTDRTPNLMNPNARRPRKARHV